ncbi:capsule biosynthesis protein [Bradyrhizobium sp.]|uniref:capsule biosynthesis protein n=1 Tax=Bradyrhizobium sp. TaxID=376 RepID=UPI0039E21B35
MSAALDSAVRTSVVVTKPLPVRRLAIADSDARPAPAHRSNWRQALFVVVVAIPTLVAVVYLTCIAANQYTSETRFLVRSPQRASSGLISGFLQSTGFVRAQDDSYAVTDFVKSRDAVARLAARHHLRDMLSRPEADIFTRFPSIWHDATAEGLFRHYLGFIKVQTDSASGISTLEVRAFRPDDARALALSLLEESEALVNRLNDRARQDAIRSAQAEVDGAEHRFADVQEQIAEFRNRVAMVDPDKQATSILDLISKLSLDAVEKRARIYEIERQAPASPQVPALRASIAALEDQIARERSRVVGGNASIAASLSQYESLLLQRELAARRVNSASVSLETARLDSQRQQLYIERIVEPNMPDHASHPKVIYSIVLTLIIALAVYLIIRACDRYLHEHAEQEL